MKRAARFVVCLFLLAICTALYGREFDLETDIGVVAESQPAAKHNSEVLTAALQAQWPGGKFKFVDGHVGPVLGDIKAAAKRFYFVPGIETMHRTGGSLHGSGGRCWPL